MEMDMLVVAMSLRFKTESEAQLMAMRTISEYGKGGEESIVVKDGDYYRLRFERDGEQIR